MVTTNTGGIYNKPENEKDTKFIDASLKEKRGEEMDMAIDELREKNIELEEKIKEKEAIIEKMAREKDFIKRRR